MMFNYREGVVTFATHERYDGTLSIWGTTPDNDLVKIQGSVAWFPETTPVLISYGLYVMPEMRGKGLSRAYNTALMRVAQRNNAKAVIAFVGKDNKIQQTRLTSLGWLPQDSGLWIRRLTHD